MSDFNDEHDGTENDVANKASLMVLQQRAAEWPHFSPTRERVVRGFELEYLTALLTFTMGNGSHASRLARLDRVYLHRLLKKHGLNRVDFQKLHEGHPLPAGGK